jgi:hypothetical protein
VQIPTVRAVVRFGTEQLAALATLPGSVILLNRSLLEFAETLRRFDALVRRLNRVTEPLEAPLLALAPRLEALVPLLDEDLLRSLPPVLDSVQRNGLPALEALGQTQSQVAALASSLERLMNTMDDGFARFQELPGAALMSRLRASGLTTRGVGAGFGGAGSPAATSPAGGAVPAPESGPGAAVEPGPGAAPGPESGLGAPLEPGPGAAPAPESGPGAVPGPAPDPPPGRESGPGAVRRPGPSAPSARPARTSSDIEEHRSWRG